MDNIYKIIIFTVTLLFISCGTTPESETEIIWAKNYARRRVFKLEPKDKIINLEVYVDDNNDQNNNQGITYYGVAYLDINDDNIPNDTINPTNYHWGYFTLQREGPGEHYRFLPDANVIELNDSLPTYYVLGVWYVTASADTIGRKPNALDSTIQLKLICPEQLDTTSFTYNYEMKNYYYSEYLDSRFDSLKIYYGDPDGEHSDKNNQGVPFIEVLELDKNPKDGLIDENQVYLSDGWLLRFPYDKPFADSTRLDDPDPEIYANPYMTGNGKYYLSIFYSETDTTD